MFLQLKPKLNCSSGPSGYYNDVFARRRSAVGKHSAAAGSGVSTTESTASGLKLSAMSSSEHDDATPDAPSTGASTAAATASAGALVEDAVVNPDVTSVEPGAVSAAGQSYHYVLQTIVDFCFYNAYVIGSG